MIENLEESFIAELGDVMHAERQLLTALPKMAQAAENSRLRSAFEWHLEETETHVQRLEQVFRLLSHKPEAHVCEGMQGILSEGREQMQKTPQGPVRDAMLIGSGQKVEHYEIATYGTLCAWAEELGEFEICRVLEQTLAEEKNADRMLSRIAENTSNRQAERGDFRTSRDRRVLRDEDRRWERYDDEGRGRSMEMHRGDREMEFASRERGRSRWGRDPRSED